MRRSGPRSPSTLSRVQTRTELLEVWLRKNRSQLPTTHFDDTRRRLRAHVVLAGDWFADVPAGVLPSDTERWDAEPYAADGDGVGWFTRVLDRVGPLAGAVVADGLRWSADSALRAALRAHGVPDPAAGRRSPSMPARQPQPPGRFAARTVSNYLNVKEQGGRILTRLSSGVGALLTTPDGDAAARQALLGDPIGLVGRARPDAQQAHLDWVLAHRNLLAQFAAVDPQQAVGAATRLCLSTCDRQPAGGDGLDLDEQLYGLFTRWVKAPDGAARSCMNADAAARFAHTLLHPDLAWQLQPELKQVLLERQQNLVGQAQRMRLTPSAADALVAGSMQESEGRVVTVILDAYVDPSRTPTDWDEAIRNAVRLRDPRPRTAPPRDPLAGKTRRARPSRPTRSAAGWTDTFAAGNAVDEVVSGALEAMISHVSDGLEQAHTEAVRRLHARQLTAEELEQARTWVRDNMREVLTETLPGTDYPPEDDQSTSDTERREALRASFGPLAAADPTPILDRVVEAMTGPLQGAPMDEQLRRAEAALVVQIALARAVAGLHSQLQSLKNPDAGRAVNVRER